MKKKFDLHSQLNEELQEFQKEITIASTQQGKKDRVRNLDTEEYGYTFNQHDTLQKVDHYTNDTFVSGQTDDQGRRKLFLNIINFRIDVATKQTDLDVKDFLFIPEDGGSTWGSYIMGREFKDWAVKNDFSQLINQVNEDRNKYGTAVVKKTKEGLERIKISNIINEQSAESLETADYVIEKHCDMDYDDLKEFPDWDVEQLNLNFGEKVEIYERYGKVPKSYLKRKKGEEDIEESDYVEGVETMAIIAKCNGDEDKRLLFIEEVNERPYLETHFERVDGRWLGKGVAEKQFENQIAQNMTANMRRKDLEWASKKIFQTADPNIGDQFLHKVKNGYVLEVEDEVGQVQTASESLPDYGQNEQIWRQNSDKKAFTFEAATGESMPSGTPFRLGAILSKSVNSHFNRKREELGTFFRSVTIDFILPTFKKDKRQKHIVTFFSGETGVTKLAKELVDYKVSKRINEQLLKGNLINPRRVREEVREEMLTQDEIFMELPEGFYDQLMVKTDIVITGETENIDSRIATLRTNYNLMRQSGDPRAEKVLEKINSLAGENLSVVAGDRRSVRRTARQAQGAGGELEQVESPQTSPNEQPQSTQPQNE